MTERVMWEQQDPAFDMEEIDRIDEENRRKDLFQLLDGINSFSALPIHFTEGDNQVDFEIHSLDWDENTNIENNDDEQRMNDSNVGLDNSHNLYTLDSSEAPKRNKLNHDVVKNLINGLHIRNTEVHTLKYQLKHKELQIEALLTQEQKQRIERDQLEYTVAKNEQDLTLLETKLQDVARYEGRSGEEEQLEYIRGQLLTLANRKVTELSEELLKVRFASETNQDIAENKITQQASEIKSLHVELENVCNQLAQRTVLYSAHERRWSNALRLNEGINNDMKEELIQLRARTQDLNDRYSKLDTERIRLLMENKEILEKNNRLEVELSGINEKVHVYADDIAALSAQNTTLQNTVNRLKSSDYDSLERDVAQEVETMRREFRLREDVLRRQVDEMRERQQTDAQRQEELVQRVHDLQNELKTKNELLVRINESLLHNSISTVSALSHIVSSDPAPTSSADQALESNDIQASLSATSVATAAQLGESSVGQHMSGSLSQDFLIGDESTVNEQYLPLNSSNHSVVASDASVSAYIQQVEEAEPKLTQERVDRQSGRDVTINLTKGEISKITHVSERSYQMTERLLEKNEELLRELDAAYGQIEAAKSRESKLASAYQKQSSKLALVLRKAAEMEMRDFDSNSEQDNSFENSRDYSDVYEQLESYKQEVRQFEQLAERNRELGAQEAATKYEQRYEPELRALQQQVDSLRHVNRQLNEQLAQLPSEVESSRLTSQTLIADLNDQLIKLTKEKDECLRQLANYEVDEISRRSMLASSAPDQSSSDNQQLNLTQYDIDSKFWSNQSVSLSMHRTNPAPVATDGDEAVLTLAQIASTPIETISTLNNTISSSKEDQLMEELARSVALVAPLRQRCEDLETKLASANAIQSEQSAELVTYRAAMEEQSTQLSALQNNLNMRNECFEKLLAIYRCVLAEVDKTKLKIASISNTNILEELRSQLSFNEISSSEFVSAIRNILSVLLSEFESVDIEASEYTNSDVVIGDISLPSPSATFSTIISTQIEFMRLFQDYAYNSVEFIERLGVRVNNSDDQKSNRIVELTTQLQLAKSELDDMMTQLHQKETETKEFQSNVNMEVEANREQILRLRETIVSEREKIQLIGQEHEQKMLTFQTQLNAVLEQRDQAIVRAETAEADMQTEDDFSLKEEVITLTEPLQSTNTFISSINNTTDTVSATATVSADDHISTQIRQQFEHKYQAKKKILKAKLRGILQKQAGALEEQRVLITDAVRAEYEDQVTVMKEQLQKLTKTVATSSRSNSGIQFVFEDDDTAKMKQVLLYPEMLGPDVTMELVSSIARRSCSLDDFQELFHQARVNDNSNE